jgi:hypothetical protein
LIVLYVYLIQANTEMLSRAGHKLFLEQKINELLRYRVMLEEGYVALTLHGKTKLGRESIVMIQSIMAAVLLGVITLAAVNFDALKTLGWKLTFAIALGVGLVNLAIALWEQSQAYARGYMAAKEGFETGQAPSGSSLLKAAESTGPTDRS